MSQTPQNNPNPSQAANTDRPTPITDRPPQTSEHLAPWEWVDLADLIQETCSQQHLIRLMAEGINNALQHLPNQNSNAVEILVGCQNLAWRMRDELSELGRLLETRQATIRQRIQDDQP